MASSLDSNSEILETSLKYHETSANTSNSLPIHQRESQEHLDRKLKRVVQKLIGKQAHKQRQMERDEKAKMRESECYDLSPLEHPSMTSKMIPEDEYGNQYQGLFQPSDHDIDPETLEDTIPYEPGQAMHNEAEAIQYHSN